MKDRDIQYLLAQKEVHLSLRTICNCRKLLNIPNYREKAAYYGKEVTFSDYILLSKKYFTKIDISLVNQIDIVSKKASIVTTHPTSSYELSPDKLVIKDTKEFWAASKYLVIIVD